MSDTATITVKVYFTSEPQQERDDPSQETELVETVVREMPQNLPARNLGDALFAAIHRAWQNGNDPTKCKIVVTFT